MTFYPMDEFYSQLWDFISWINFQLSDGFNLRDESYLSVNSDVLLSLLLTLVGLYDDDEFSSSWWILSQY